MAVDRSTSTPVLARHLLYCILSNLCVLHAVLRLWDGLCHRCCRPSRGADSEHVGSDTHTFLRRILCTKLQAKAAGLGHRSGVAQPLIGPNRGQGEEDVGA